MANQRLNSSAITRDCTNFMNFLKAELGVEKFGEFICSYSFPLKEIEDLKAMAAAADKTPVSLRLYYGCDKNGKDHKLHMALLDKNQEVIVDSTQLNKNLSTTNLLAAPMAQAAVRKCPPGGTSSDRLISSLF